MSNVLAHTPARIAAASLTAAVVATGAAVATAGSANAATGGSVWDRVAACESGGNWSINTGNGFSGGLQFTPSTWAAYGGTGSAQNASRAEQIAVAQRVLASQGPGAWPVCSRVAGLTSSNGGSASSDSSSYTVSSYTAPTTASTASTASTVIVSSSRSEQRAALAGTDDDAATSSSAHPTASGTHPRTVHHTRRFEIRVIQRHLGVRADGILGPITTRAIQKYVGVTQDGIVGPVTVAAVEKMVGLKPSGAIHLTRSRVDALAAYLQMHPVPMH